SRFYLWRLIDEGTFERLGHGFGGRRAAAAVEQGKQGKSEHGDKATHKVLMSLKKSVDMVKHCHPCASAQCMDEGSNSWPADGLVRPYALSPNDVTRQGYGNRSRAGSGW